MKFLRLLPLLLLLGSCVSMKRYNELKKKEGDCQHDLSGSKDENQKLNSQAAELQGHIDQYKRAKAKWENDSAEITRQSSELTRQLTALQADYNEMLGRHEKMISGNNEESKKLISNLQKNQEELQAKEDGLKKTQADLATKEQELKQKQVQFDQTNAKLKEREKRVKELEHVLQQKDSAVAALRKTVADALLNFKESGLTVEQRNGKVYVSLEERLLFASGSTAIDKKGVEALKQLAKVLEKNLDINVMIEGHTDDVPVAGGVYKDNWDLSVLRATSIVRILTQDGKLDPKRLTAAGRGEFIPVDPAKTTEARKKNRRTEIILTPKLNELFKVLENN